MLPKRTFFAVELLYTVNRCEPKRGKNITINKTSKSDHLQSFSKQFPKHSNTLIFTHLDQDRNYCNCAVIFFFSFIFYIQINDPLHSSLCNEIVFLFLILIYVCTELYSKNTWCEIRWKICSPCWIFCVQQFSFSCSLIIILHTFP